MAREPEWMRPLDVPAPKLLTLVLNLTTGCQIATGTPSQAVALFHSTARGEHETSPTVGRAKVATITGNPIHQHCAVEVSAGAESPMSTGPTGTPGTTCWSQSPGSDFTFAGTIRSIIGLYVVQYTTPAAFVYIWRQHPGGDRLLDCGLGTEWNGPLREANVPRLGRLERLDQSDEERLASFAVARAGVTNTVRVTATWR